MAERDAHAQTLFVIMPVYNEAEVVASVLREWIPVLRSYAESFALCCIDDGSRDDSGRILHGLDREISELEVVHKQNEGHGAACRDGYRLALERGSAWILQLDSDGQCDPADFAALWEQRGAGAVFGLRRQREDGAARTAISFALRQLVHWAAGVSVRDANVPFRLFRRDVLAAALERVPRDFELFNVGLAVAVERAHGIRWTPIRFRRRVGGASSIGWLGFATRGRRAIRDLWKLRRAAG